MGVQSISFRRICFATLLFSLAAFHVFAQDRQQPRLADAKPLSAATADEAPSDNLRLDKKALKRWGEFYQAEADQYEIFLDDDPNTKLKLVREPAFRWASPNENNEFNGVVFVWTRAGRPEVVGSIWSKNSSPRAGKRTICHTFHSLASGPLHANRKGEPWWNPTVPGIEPKLVPGAPLPARSARLRLAQMRAMTRAFTVSQYVDRAETKEDELRLLPRPIFRYQAETEDAPDGAIFAYLHGWDAEVLLVIETRETPAGPRWHYAPIRFCYLSARVKHNDKLVWTYDRGGPMHDRQHYYLSIHGASVVDRYFGLKDEESP